MKSLNLIFAAVLLSLLACLQPTLQDLLDLISHQGRHWKHFSPIGPAEISVEYADPLIRIASYDALFTNIHNHPLLKEMPVRDETLLYPLHKTIQKTNRQKRASNSLKSNAKILLSQPKECGINGKSTGGVKSKGPSETKDWPWIAALLRSNSYSNFCGGVLLNRNYVLTAAHCVFRFQTSDMYVRLGEYDFFEQNETVYADFSPLEIKVHPEYDRATEQHDIALLKLNTSTKYSDFIRPVCLPSVKARTNETVVVAGWGTIYYGGPISNVLMEVPVPVWDLQNCISKYTQPVFNTNLCAAAYEGGKDACQGDSGGPLLMQQSNGRWVSIGVVSWGISCGEKDQPGIYTNVGAYVDWIVTNMQDAHL